MLTLREAAVTWASAHKEVVQLGVSSIALPECASTRSTGLPCVNSHKLMIAQDLLDSANVFGRVLPIGDTSAHQSTFRAEGAIEITCNQKLMPERYGGDPPVNGRPDLMSLSQQCGFWGRTWFLVTLCPDIPGMLAD